LRSFGGQSFLFFRELPQHIGAGEKTLGVGIV
jgi:hypothetical protein